MLTNSRNRSLDENDDQDFIHNYYERLVLQEIFQQSSRVQVGDRDFLADVACVALNRLPPRYIRHNVDMTFFMSPQDLQEVEAKVTNAVAVALEYVEKREQGEDAQLPPVFTHPLAATFSQTRKAGASKKLTVSDEEAQAPSNKAATNTVASKTASAKPKTAKSKK